LITRIQELSSNSVAPHFGLPGKQILVSQGFAVGTSPGSVEEKCEWRRQCCIGPPVYASGPSKGKRKKVGITADGTRAKKGIIAADIRRYPYGTRMHVPGYGWGVVHDKGRAIQGDHIDVFFRSHQDATEWGRRKLWVTVIRKQQR